MASADENSVQLQSNPAFPTPPAPVVKCGSFHSIPCFNRLGSFFSPDELIKFYEQAQAPHPIYNPAKPCRISARSALNNTSDE
jgi:hypothetical protein